MLGKMSQGKCLGMALQKCFKARPKEKHQSKTSLDLGTSIHEISYLLLLCKRAALTFCSCSRECAEGWDESRELDLPGTGSREGAVPQELPLSHPEGMIKGHQHARDTLRTLMPFLGDQLLPSKSNTCLRMLLSHCQPLEKLLPAGKMLLKLLKTIPPCHFSSS